MESSQILERRLNKIKNWIKNPSNLILLTILVFTVIIRLYYFALTKNQPLWWDETEYLNMARAWAFNLDYNFIAVRPVLLSFIAAGFLKISQTEFLPRLLILFFSIFSVLGMYYLGKELYNKKIALLATFLMSIFYLNLFFSFRLLVELPALACFTFAGFFFWKYFKENSIKSLYFAVIITAIGILFKLSTALILFVVLIYILIVDKLKCLRKKEYWIAALIFLLILSPYIIWGYSQFNGFVITQAGTWNAATENKISTGINVLVNYLTSFPTYLSWPLLVIFLLGLLSFYRLFFGFDLLLKKANKTLKRDLFIFLLFLIPLVMASFSVSHNENRYILNAFPAIFIVISLMIFTIFKLIKQKSKVFAIIFLILFIIFAFNFQFNAADSLIKGKLNTYSQVKGAGLWINQNSNPSDLVATSSAPQINYYSEREVVGFPGTSKEFETQLELNSNIRFMVISSMEQSPEWVYNYPVENSLVPVQAYFADLEKKQPILIIYQLK
jgi:4-amino-4-deoxy-L-arabinose transferase-like glycosyltransferase